jgi:hypothetical protein
MNRNHIVKLGAIVMIFSLLITIFVGAMSVMAATPTTSLSGISVPEHSSPKSVSDQLPTSVHQGPNPDIDGDGIANNEDPDLDGDGIDNGVDPDIDGDGIVNGQDGNPTSTNNVDSVPPKDARVETAWQWGGGLAVLAVLGWLVALPYLRKRKGTSSRSVGSRGKTGE